MPLQRLTDDDIKAMAAALLGGNLVVASALPEDMLASVFMPLGLGGLPQDIAVEDIGNIVEFMDKAGPRAVNGYPIFMSCQIVHRDDWDQVVKRYENVRAALDA